MGMHPFPSWTALYDSCRKRLGKVETRLWQRDFSDLLELLQKCAWFEFYDCVEAIYEAVASCRGSDIREFGEEINRFLQQNGLGYVLREGLLERRGSHIEEARRAEARLLLTDPRYKGPDAQFKEAIRHLSKRPTPEIHDAIADAVGSLEGVARILTSRQKDTLGDILPQLVSQGIVPRPLKKAFEGVYGYRSSEGGVAHGLVGEAKVTIEIAELILGLCGSMIIYLHKASHSKQVEEKK